MASMYYLIHCDDRYNNTRFTARYSILRGHSTHRNPHQSLVMSSIEDLSFSAGPQGNPAQEKKVERVFGTNEVEWVGSER